MAESKAQRGDIAVELVVPDDLPPIQGDEHQLCQVFTNLVINAFEALAGAGRVRITAATGIAEGEQTSDLPVPVPTVVIQVVDDGPGIPPELTDRVFNAFFTTKAQGSGLGLAIVRKIIDAHDGRIDVTTAPDQGTTFTVTLPVGAEEWFQ
jgi:two-component system nitrogen regulation sensor histidine kinase GlnL